MSVEVTRKNEPIAISDDNLWALVGIALDSLALQGHGPFQLSQQRRRELVTRVVQGNWDAAPFGITARFTNKINEVSCDCLCCEAQECVCRDDPCPCKWRPNSSGGGKVEQ